MLETGNSYPGMLQKLYPLITKARKALKSQVPEVERRVTEMQFVLKDIGIIRTPETNPYLAKDVEEAFGFPLELTTARDRRLDIPTNEINWDLTNSRNTAAIKKIGLTDVKAWIANYGYQAKNPFKDEKYRYKPAATSHYVVRDAIDKAEAELMEPV